ncbi:MAG: dNTP triphosphohydrolase [Bacteroidales bacterium]|nr:dNTP triphosphohydrolase [Bacteroidales bacterium]
MTTFPDFSKVKMDKDNPKWELAISRIEPIYSKPYDPRSPFERDMQRIMHSQGYRRLKNKTQVFFAPHNDHVCTRIEHVTHVASVAETIAKLLNLNLDLVRAIAIGHDIGHAPFGHHGETVLQNIAEQNNLHEFWHENNSLRFIDKIETLPDYDGVQQNLNLTYAVKDGIVCHCGEIDERFIKPREEMVDLYTIQKGGKLGAYTYEGCVVKISDKIGYIGRDIEDACTYGILTDKNLKELLDIVCTTYPDIKLSEINTTVLIHKFIMDLCQNSSIETGLCFSDDCYRVMKLIRDFNFKNIYDHPRISRFKKYATLILETIFEKLSEYYPYIKGNITKEKQLYPKLLKEFEEWLIKYSDYNLALKTEKKLANKQIYNISEETDYKNAIIDFISGMSDNFAIDVYNELISF